jgi:hypothetical protein
MVAPVCAKSIGIITPADFVGRSRQRDNAGLGDLAPSCARPINQTRRDVELNRKPMPEMALRCRFFRNDAKAR